MLLGLSPGLPAGAVVAKGAGLAGLVPAAPTPTVTLQRCKSSAPVELAASTAMLEAPAEAPAAATNPKSANVTPDVSPWTASASPLGGAIVALSAALYAHFEGTVVQSRPPNACTPSRELPTTRFSAA
jgi:hypothetical protein